MVKGVVIERGMGGGVPWRSFTPEQACGDLPSWELSSLKRHCALLVSQVSDHAETYRRT